MQTQSFSRLVSDQYSNPTSSINPNLKGRNHRHSNQRVENSNLEEHSHPVVMMADQRTMAQLLQAPTEGYKDEIVISSITFFPPSKTTSLRNEITNFQQRFNESFSEAWDRFKDLLRACPRHGFLELHQLDTFYNALNSKDQDSLNSAARALLLDKKGQSQSLAPVKAIEKVVLLAVVLILTEIVRPPMATFIVTTFKNLYLKPPQLTTTKEMPVIVLK
nr:reverse transcriptase domain-containing protein [Tanacetum cinerariifolium]